VYVRNVEVGGSTPPTSTRCKSHNIRPGEPAIPVSDRSGTLSG
jgi:hypothetical protein